MELYRNTADLFINYLKRHGYREECIALEYGNKQYAIDIAILARDMITPIAIYEIKGKKTEQSIQFGLEQLKRAANNLENNVSCNLVFGDERNLGFEVIDVTKNVYNNEPINIPEIMKSTRQENPVSYNNLQAGATSKVIQKNLSKKQKKIDNIKWFCWLLFPIISVALLVLDAIGVYKITTLRIAVVGACVVVVLIPFFSEISLKDVTLKRIGGK